MIDFAIHQTVSSGSSPKSPTHSSPDSSASNESISSSTLVSSISGTHLLSIRIGISKDRNSVGPTHKQISSFSPIAKVNAIRRSLHRSFHQLLQKLLRRTCIRCLLN